MVSILSRVAILAACIALLILSGAAQAQNCGSPPDPRSNTAGYASWCNCMGGSYNYQTTACTGARTGGARPQGGSSQLWYCRAQARNGAWGWGEFASQSDATQRALNECRNYARGRPCSIQYCRLGGGPAQRPTQAARAPRRAAAYGCDTCARKLRADLRSGWASGRLHSYVDQAIAGYENCKLKAAGSCTTGDVLVRTVRNGCSGFDAETAYRACLGRTLGF